MYLNVNILCHLSFTVFCGNWPNTDNEQDRFTIDCDSKLCALEGEYSVTLVYCFFVGIYPTQIMNRTRLTAEEDNSTRGEGEGLLFSGKEMSSGWI